MATILNCSGGSQASYPLETQLVALPPTAEVTLLTCFWNPLLLLNLSSLAAKARQIRTAPGNSAVPCHFSQCSASSRMPTAQVDVCRLLTSVPRSMSACMRELFQRVSVLDPQLRSQLAEWLAYHLSNFDFMWPWAKWSYVVQASPHDAQRSSCPLLPFPSQCPCLQNPDVGVCPLKLKAARLSLVAWSKTLVSANPFGRILLHLALFHRRPDGGILVTNLLGMLAPECSTSFIRPPPETRNTPPHSPSLSSLQLS